MTSRGWRPAGRHQRPFDLLEELVLGDPEAEERQPENHGVLERDVVLPERVPHHVLRPEVVDAVDLDDDVPLVPVDVEVVGPVAATADDLPGRLRDAAAPAGERELPLAE